MDNEASNPENQEGHKTSFWDFLKGDGVEVPMVEVPIIQRDYAQGRVGKEFLRTKFLEDLKKALDNKVELVLDFVYGSENIYVSDKGEKTKLIRPLDGQQRLTTLWLLHWYIALRAGQLTKENCEVLKRFTYETRISSREFCENLCKPENFTLFTGGKIVDFIEKQTWFYSAWKQDPTIQSMLRMLSGTEGDDDGIEGVFDFERTEEYEACWGKLTTDAPIVFYYMPLKDFGLSDDLYVKMNARGKPLTPFENFKADLIGYLSKRALGEDDKLSENERREWIRLYETIPAKLDNDWTDIFWDKISNKDKKDDEQKIDEIYFAFLNRFFWNELFVAKTNNEYVLRFSKGSKLESPNSSFEYLDEDSVDEYLGIERYEFLDGRIPTKLFKDLRIVLDRYKAYMDQYKKFREDRENPLSDLVSKEEWDSIPFPDIFFPKWIRGDFEFIPKYKRNDEGNEYVSPLTQPQRVIFFALCKYFTEEKTTESPTETSFVALKQWMRVVCNLVSGRDRAGDPQIESNSGIRMAIGYLEKLSRYTHNVLEGLDVQPIERDSNPFSFREKWNEEIIKAKKILENRDWEAKIIEAEEYAFFEGTIRFLYQGEDGEDGEEDWGNFNTKWENAQKYFLEKPETRQNEEIWVKNNSVDLLKALISLISSDDFESVLQDRQSLNNHDDSWRYYLLNPNICANIHQLLTLKVKNGRIPIRPRSYSGSFSENPYEHALYYLSQTKLLDRLVEVIPYSWIRWKNGSLVIREKNSKEKTRKYVLLDTSKYDFLENRDVTKREESYEIEGTKLHFEFANICFHYGSYNFILYRDDNLIYLQPKDPKGWEGVLEEGTDTEYHFGTPIDDVAADWENDEGKVKEKKIENFLSELKKLGDKARAAGHDEV